MSFKMASYDFRLFGQALTPSIFSSIFCVTIGVVVVAALVIDVQLKGSFLPIALYDFGNMGVGGEGDSTYSIILADIGNRLSAFTIWAIFAAIVLVLVLSIFGAIRHARQFKAELKGGAYMRKTIMADAATRFVAHIITLAAWAAYMWFFFAFIVGYVISAAIAGGVELPTFTGIGFICIAAMLLTVGLFMHVVFLRILLLKPRVFGVADYIVSIR